jgi:protein-disulfide isomerase
MASAAKKTNWFAIVISAIVVVALVGVGAVVVWMNNTATAPAEAPAAAVVNEETGAITLGEGPNVVAEYFDFMCPYCGRYWETYSEDVNERVVAGEVTLEMHPISILDNASQGTAYSTRAAGAVYCVAEENADAVYPFVDLLFDNQPREATAGLSDEEIIGYAERAGAEGAASCIEGGELPIAPGQTRPSTPTVLVNDEFLGITWDPEADLVPLLTK